MTTIAVSLDSMEMAADSRCSGDDGSYNVEKIRKGKDCYYAGAGDWEKLLRFYNALENLKEGAELDSEMDVEVIELREDGIYVYEGVLIPSKLKNRFFAVGTGANYAIAAMHMGANPEEAVKIAAVYDPATGGPIDVVRLTPAKPSAVTKAVRAVKRLTKK